jgi:arylsulfatase A-like enzyme
MFKNIKRRRFLKMCGALSPLISANYSFCNFKKKQPNILIIITDQQHSKMMSCAGNEYVKTPAMDSIATSGVRFDRAYCTNPVCVPSRFSLMTGRMPSEIGMRNNSSRHVESIPAHIKENGLGHLLQKAGYETVYGGKVHLPKMQIEDVGFKSITKNERDELAKVASDYISHDHQQPFCLVASFINPHDICYMAIRDSATSDSEKSLLKKGVTELERLDKSLERPDGVGHDNFINNYCPPLPENFDPQKDEPEAIRWLLAQRSFRVFAREKWTEQRWREHRWAYARLTEMVDKQIGVVLDALQKNGNSKDTIIIFTSDHGDMDSAHRMEHKSAFYDEASRIPLIISGPGIKAGIVDSDHLVSNGLDLVPTVCDFAGAKWPENLKGKSVRPLAEGNKTTSWRNALPVENEIGKMIVTKKFKYKQFDRGRNEEQLFDLEKDPGENKSVANSPEYKKTLDQHRALFNKVFV